jgi:hypothetical protein
MRSLRTIRSYDDLQAALRERSADLRMRRLDLDARAGLADGHSGKLLGPGQKKRFGIVTLGLVLQALRVRLIMVDDSDEPLEPIDASARMLAARRVSKQSPEQRSAAARKAAQTRWHRQ